MGFQSQSLDMQSQISKGCRRFPTAMPALLAAGLWLGAAGFAPAFASTQGGAAIPEGLRPVLYRTLVGSSPVGGRVAQNGCASLENQDLEACFDDGGARFTAHGAPSLNLRLKAFGRGSKLTPVGVAVRTISEGRVNYRYPALTEWWRVLPAGYEQGFTVERRPAGAGPLTLALAADRSPHRYGDNLGWGHLRYGGLAVTDAGGRSVPAMLGAQGDRIVITIDDSDARYPLTVDPLVWIPQVVRSPSSITTNSAQGAPAAATSVTIPSAFGAAVAFSGDTAFLSAPFSSVAGNTQQGAVFVYTEAADRTWSESTLLTAADGAAYDQFGSALAVSGTSLLIGAPGASVGGNSTQGAVYVFNSTGGVWSEAQKLTASDGAAGDEFGGALSISGADALIGARTATVGGNARAGAVYTFNDAGGNWSETQKLTASDAAAGDLFGSAVALDGTTALVGAPAASVAGDAFRGAVYDFVNVGGVWGQTQKLTASDGATGDQFGASVALDGITALVGAPFANVSGQVSQGKAYVFTASGGSWAQQAVLSASDGKSSDEFGSAIVIAGVYALVGGEGGSGNAYLFGNEGSGWTQLVEFSGGGSGFGRAVALEGTMALVSAPNTNIGGSGGFAIFYGNTNLSLTLDAPATATSKGSLPNDMVLTNNAATDSPPVSLITYVPNGATYISATPTQGSCTRNVTIICDFGQVPGNGGTAGLHVMFKLTTAKSATTVASLAVVTGAVPEVSASAATRVKGQPSSGGGAFGFDLLGLLGIFAAAVTLRRRAVRVKFRSSSASRP